jgi:ubiquinone biosynthesis protein
VLSTRPDLVSPAYEAELAKLQDAAPPVAWADVEATVTRALGGDTQSLFGGFTRAPLAAASIGQVHEARLVDGTDVVVKVRRPGVVAQIDVDLRLLRRAARLAARLRAARRFDPVGIAAEFGATLDAELHYVQEGQNAERIARELAGLSRVQVPAVVWDRTTDDVLTETRIVGAKIDDLATIDEYELDRRVVARDFADAYLTMVFVHRFFHADPHPGNVFVSPEGMIGFVDFGMVGSVDEQTGRGLAEVLGALVTTDAVTLARALLTLGIAGSVVDRAGLETDLAELLGTYRDRPLEDLRLAAVIADLMAVVRRRDLRLPSRIALLLKTVVMCEGVAAQLDPDFQLVPLLLPYAARLATPGVEPAPREHEE